MAGPMPVKSVGGNECVVDDYSWAVYSRSSCLKSEVVNMFKTFKAAEEHESNNKLHEAMTDNACELSMGEICTICNKEGIRLGTTVPYHLASNRIAKHAIGVFNNATQAVL